MALLLKLRDVVLGCLERARGTKELRSSLEAQVDICVPDDTWLEKGSETANILKRHRKCRYINFRSYEFNTR